MEFQNEVSNKGMHDDVSTPKQNKVDGAFTDGDWENVFPVDRDIFLVINTYQGKVQIHLRHYKRFGSKLYPTKDGLALQPEWFDRIFSRPAPTTELELEAAHFFTPVDFKIKTLDFAHFELCRGSRHITLTADEWNSLANRLDMIITMALRYLYQDYDFKKEFLHRSVVDVQDALHALEYATLSVQELKKVLVNCLRECVKMQEEVAIATLFGDPAVLHTDSITSFNRCVLYLNPQDIVELFHSRLFGMSTLFLPDVASIEQFLDSIHITQIIEEARFEHCALDCFVKSM